MIENTSIYEQPLNELIRTCLRLEQLFQQVDHCIGDQTLCGTRSVVSSIIQILHLLDRPDLKAKLAKELNYHLIHLGRLEHTPQIDQKKLRQVLRQLDELMRCFIDSNGKIAQSLRDIELLNNLRLHLTTPGGGCSFDTPNYYYWLQQPGAQRQETIKQWLAEFSSVRTAVTLILQLIRGGTKIVEKTADRGLFQEMLDPQLNLRLLRIAVPDKIAAYPEISISRHFLGVRFLHFISPIAQERPVQFAGNLSFWLAYGS